MAGRRLSFAWLKPPPVPADGTMSLYDHLRELRYRFTVSALAIIITSTIAAFFYRPLLEFVMWPYSEGIRILQESNKAQILIVNQGSTSPFVLALKTCAWAGLIAACPVWIWQLWAFIVPGLLTQERKWALRFMFSAVPLFLLGAATGYLVMPRGIAVMLQFTPEDLGITNMQDLNAFLDLEMKLILIFGLAFLLPIVLIFLNIIGVLSAQAMKKARVYAIFGTFVFGAMVTPSTDPVSMLALALPMALLYLGAELFAHVHDRRKARAAEGDLLGEIELKDADI